MGALNMPGFEGCPEGEEKGRLGYGFFVGVGMRCSTVTASSTNTLLLLAAAVGTLRILGEYRWEGGVGSYSVGFFGGVLKCLQLFLCIVLALWSAGKYPDHFTPLSLPP